MPRQYHLPKFFPVHLLLVDRFPSEDYFAANYHGPVGITGGGRGPSCAGEIGVAAFNAGYAGPKRLWEFPLDDHGTVMERLPRIWEQIIAFFAG